jgi:hypothetical protein
MRLNRIQPVRRKPYEILAEFIEPGEELAPVKALRSDIRMMYLRTLSKRGEARALAGWDKQNTVPATTSIAARPAQRLEHGGDLCSRQLI